MYWGGGVIVYATLCSFGEWGENSVGVCEPPKTGEPPEQTKDPCPASSAVLSHPDSQPMAAPGGESVTLDDTKLLHQLFAQFGGIPL